MISEKVQYDSRVTVVKAWNDAIQKYSHCNVVVTKHTFDNLFGLTNDVIMEAIFPMLSREERAEC